MVGTGPANHLLRVPHNRCVFGRRALWIRATWECLCAAIEPGNRWASRSAAARLTCRSQPCGEVLLSGSPQQSREESRICEKGRSRKASAYSCLLCRGAAPALGARTAQAVRDVRAAGIQLQHHQCVHSSHVSPLQKCLSLLRMVKHSTLSKQLALTLGAMSQSTFHPPQTCCACCRRTSCTGCGGRCHNAGWP